MRPTRKSPARYGSSCPKAGGRCRSRLPSLSPPPAQAAQAVVQVLELDVADVRVGYIMGSGDEIPEAIQRMGLDVTLLEEEDLATGDLTRFYTIVVGGR